jgi:hypothetical protein
VGRRDASAAAPAARRRGRRARAGALGAGLIRFCIGLLLLALAGLVARPALPTLRTYTVMETAMLVAALIVEQLVGDDLRGAARKRTTHS